MQFDARIWAGSAGGGPCAKAANPSEMPEAADRNAAAERPGEQIRTSDLRAEVEEIGSFESFEDKEVEDEK